MLYCHEIYRVEAVGLKNDNWADNSWLQYKPRGLYKGAAYTMKVQSYSRDFTEVRLIFRVAYNLEITVCLKNYDIFKNVKFGAIS